MAEDYELFRAGIRSFINDEPEINIIAEAANGAELLELLKIHTPDVILLDLQMPVMDGKEAFTKMREHYPNIKILILSQFNEQVLMDDYILRGAYGYVPKQFPEEITGAIRKAYRGAIYKYHQSPAPEIGLRPRHKEVLYLYSQGKSQDEIAEILDVSRFAIGKVEKKIMRMLNIETKEEFIKAIFMRGLNYLGPPDSQ